MVDDSTHIDRLLPRIRQELDKLPLSEEQKAQAIPKILKNMRFLETGAGTRNPGQLRSDSTMFDFEPKIRAVVERFAAQGLTARDYLQAALKRPQLFCQSPATIAANIAGVVERFAAQGLTTENYLQAALTQPPLFYMKPATVAANISGVGQQYADMGLTTKAYLHAALKQPQLFCQSPATISANIAGVVERFAGDGLTTRNYLRAALTQPTLFCQSPATIAANIAGVVERFAGQYLTTKDYLQAALTQPPLFSMKPATIARHIELILALYDDGIFALPRPRGYSIQTAEHPHPHAPVLGFLLRNPVLICLEEKNIHLRKVYKDITGAEPSPKNLLRPRHEVERELMRHLGHDDPGRPVPKDADPVLRGLIRDGYIKSAKLEASYE
jgi:hypothetical protein